MPRCRPNLSPGWLKDPLFDLCFVVGIGLLALLIEGQAADGDGYNEGGYA